MFGILINICEGPKMKLAYVVSKEHAVQQSNLRSLADFSIESLQFCFSLSDFYVYVEQQP